MILNKEQADRYYALFDSLMHYASQWLAQNNQPFMEQLRQEQAAGMPQGTAALKLIERTWSTPELFDQYVDDNPDGLPDAALDQVELWKQGLFGQFAVVQKPGHVAYFIYEDHAFEVSGLETQISQLLENDFAFARTVLLPFDERIVFGGVLAQLPAELSDEDEVARMQEFLEGRLQKALAFNHAVKTSREFVDCIDAVHEVRIQREETEKLQEEKRSFYERLAQEL